MSAKVTIVDTHPVQYRAPLYREMERLAPATFEVFYGSDFSVHGYRDAEFGQKFSWDIPLLEGYAFTVAGSGPPQGWKPCWKLARHIRRARPRALLLVDVQGRLFWTAMLTGLLSGAELWLRAETQDEAFPRPPLKARLRALYYRCAYAAFTGFFFIGRLNRDHYLAHGVAARRLHRAAYATLDPVGTLSPVEKQSRRSQLRQTLGIAAEAFVVSFFGKLIPKKNPDLLLQAFARLPMDLRGRTRLLFVGSGELADSLRQLAGVEAAAGGAQTVFAGFVNQSALPDYYLASDVVVLPSRRAGETWGLVVNEALQAGCRVVVSRAVGCAVEFAPAAGVRVIEVEDAAGLAGALEQLAHAPRDFDWARALLQDYSIPQAAADIVAALKNTVAG